jgi:hypothetical protein
VVVVGLTLVLVWVPRGMFSVWFLCVVYVCVSDLVKGVRVCVSLSLDVPLSLTLILLKGDESRDWPLGICGVVCVCVVVSEGCELCGCWCVVAGVCVGMYVHSIESKRPEAGGVGKRPTRERGEGIGKRKASFVSSLCLCVDGGIACVSVCVCLCVNSHGCLGLLVGGSIIRSMSSLALWAGGGAEEEARGGGKQARNK